MEQAKEEFVAKNEYRIAASKAELDAVHSQAYDDYEASLDAKWEAM